MNLTPYVRCPDCGKIVKVNKPFIGSTHLCVDPEQRRRRAAPRRERAERHVDDEGFGAGQ